jgi:membrane-bound lytic murein transglycosylase A
MGRLRVAAGLALLVLVSGCVRLIPETRPPTAVVTPPPPPATALQAGLAQGPAVSSLVIDPAQAVRALASFRESCPALLARSDNSGLTQVADWQPACAAAATAAPADAPAFFATWFETARVGDGKTFVTGYYEPEIAGARTHLPGYDVPVYRLPPDLIRAWPDSTPPDQRTGNPPLGRYDQSGQFVPYFDRAAIDDGALAGKGLEIAWAADPIEFFFLQIQGSGRLRAPDGTVIRIGYAGQNGRQYVGIGSVMRQRGLIGDGPGQYPGSMQGLIRYLTDHPEDGRALMRENLSYVFFRELTGDGPIGAMGVPVRPRASLATDPAFVPLGAPVFLTMDPAIAGATQANGLWIAQDTGGAIKGTNRFDSFWGAGAEARTIAGGMSGRGQALILLPKGTLVRLGAR